MEQECGSDDGRSMEHDDERLQQHLHADDNRESEEGENDERAGEAQAEERTGAEVQEAAYASTSDEREGVEELDELQQMLANKRARGVAAVHMKERVAREVEEIMDNGIRINPLLRAMHGTKEGGKGNEAEEGKENKVGGESESRREDEGSVEGGESTEHGAGREGGRSTEGAGNKKQTAKQVNRKSSRGGDRGDTNLAHSNGGHTPGRDRVLRSGQALAKADAAGAAEPAHTAGRKRRGVGRSSNEKRVKGNEGGQGRVLRSGVVHTRVGGGGRSEGKEGGTCSTKRARSEDTDSTSSRSRKQKEDTKERDEDTDKGKVGWWQKIRSPAHKDNAHHSVHAW
jgi:hypothetical protein